MSGERIYRWLDDSGLTLCRVCRGDIERLEPGNGVGSWWVHRNHPADGHDAVPADQERNEQ